MNIGNQLKHYRMINHYTQEQIAERCSVSRQAVAKWENGTSLPDVEKLLRLSEFFHVSLEMLLTGKDSSLQAEAHHHYDVQAENEKLINKALHKAMACENPNEEINMFIGYIGAMLDCDRVYIFEQDPGGDYCNTFEWCNRGVSHHIDQQQGIPAADLTSWMDSFHRGDYILIDDLEVMKKKDPGMYAWLAPKQVHTVLIFPLFDGKGFFGVDNPVTAFVNQTAVLTELVVHFVETMLQRRSLVHDLLIESDLNKDLNKVVHRAGYYVNLKTGSIVVNTEALDTLGYHFDIHSVEELHSLLNEHPECRRHILEDGFAKVQETREATAVEFVFYTHDHMIHWAKLSIRPFMDSRGNLLQLYGSLRDISDEHAIVSRYNVFTSHLRGGMHICYLSDPCHLEYASDNLCSLIGYSREEFDTIIGENYDTLIVDEDYAAFKGFVKRLTENPGSIETCEYGLKHRNGSVVHVIDTMESVLDGNGIVYGYANVMDVTEMQHSLDLARENERLQLAELDKQYEIVEALSRDYRNVFLVDLNKDQAVIHKLNGYVTQGLDRRSDKPIAYYEYCKRYIRDRVYPDDREIMLRLMHPDNIRQKLQTQDVYSDSYRILEDGKTRYAQFKYIVLDNQHRADERYNQVIAAFQIIDKVVQNEIESMQVNDLILKYDLSLEEFCLIMESIPANIFFKDTECRYRVTSHICQMLNSGGDPNFSIAGKTDREIQPDKSLGEKFYNEDREIIRIGKGMTYLQEMVFGDTPYYYQISKQLVRNVEGNILGVVGIVVDMTEEIRLQKELEQYNIKDSMTGIYNRAYYEKRMESFGKDENYPIAVIEADCDNLKSINDSLGHKAGDFLIKSTVSNLKRILPDDAEIIRVGGDEFLMLLSGCDEAACRKYIDEVSASEEELNAGKIKISTSMGYAIIPNGQTPLDQAVERADAMMYEAKKNRRTSGDVFK